MSIFHLTFPKVQKNFDATLLSFSIGNIKSRVSSVAQIKLHCYNYQGTEILVNSNPVHVGKRFVVTSEYQEHVETISLTANQLSNTYEFEVELILFGITSENPCWFNEVMLEVGEHEMYHKPAEAIDETDVVFKNNNYAVLYNLEGEGLQVIRPTHDPITTKDISRSKYTILAPHLDNEPVMDNPSRLMMEFINQTEQYIQIQK